MISASAFSLSTFRRMPKLHPCNTGWLKAIPSFQSSFRGFAHSTPTLIANKCAISHRNTKVIVIIIIIIITESLLRRNKRTTPLSFTYNWWMDSFQGHKRSRTCSSSSPFRFWTRLSLVETFRINHFFGCYVPCSSRWVLKWAYV